MLVMSVNYHPQVKPLSFGYIPRFQKPQRGSWNALSSGQDFMPNVAITVGFSSQLHSEAFRTIFFYKTSTFHHFTTNIFIRWRNQTTGWHWSERTARRFCISPSSPSSAIPLLPFTCRFLFSFLLLFGDVFQSLFSGLAQRMHLIKWQA